MIRMIGLQNMNAYRQTAMEVFQVDPNSAMKTNWNRYLQNTADRLGVPADVTRTDEEVDMMMQMQQEMMRLQQELEMLKTGTEAARNLGNAKTDGSALGELVE